LLIDQALVVLQLHPETVNIAANRCADLFSRDNPQFVPVHHLLSFSICFRSSAKRSFIFRSCSSTIAIETTS
jgi:hypothetical protein